MKTVKVGDKVRVVASNCGHGFEIGEVVVVIGAYDGRIKATDGIAKWLMTPEEYEPVAPNRIVVGGEYTGYNGRKWKCIFVDCDHAWMTMDMKSEAYVFKTDGTNISQGGGEWNIKFEPVVEWVECDLNYDPNGCTYFYDGHDREGVNLIIRFPLIDGKPDWSQAKVTEA